MRWGACHPISTPVSADLQVPDPAGFGRPRYAEKSPLAQVLASDLQVRGASGRRWAAVTVEMGSPPTRVISVIWENVVSFFSLVTATHIISLDYRA